MLQQILNALPAIFTAALILIAAYFWGGLCLKESPVSHKSRLQQHLLCTGSAITTTPASAPTRAPQPGYTEPPTERATVIQPGGQGQQQ